MSQWHIDVQNVNKFYGEYHASKNISFQVEKGKLVGLLGPSGGGKTTILRMIAGLEQPDNGSILFRGQEMNRVEPQKRGIGVVFQNYALFKHMTVFDNIAFGLNVQKKSKSFIKERVNELLDLTNLSGLGKRYPNELSGGQRQRVAFARALAPEPQILLLDEPFAAIDAHVRRELRSWLREMIDRLGITTLFVTHDQEEAIEIADQILVVNQGRIEQHGTPIEIYQSPQTDFVARFIGESTQFVPKGIIHGFNGVADGREVLIRPEFVEIGKPNEIALPSAASQGTVRHLYYRGASWEVEVEVGGELLIGNRSVEKSSLKIGDKVSVLVHRLIVFENGKANIVENQFKYDPMPVFI